MLKLGLGTIGLWVLTVFTASSPQHGCQDARRSLSNLAYFRVRDMRTTVALLPQQGFYRAPDSSSVPITGKDYVLDREALAASFVNPEPPSDSSVARGERKFQKTCIPCHGLQLRGDGPVAAKFVPPPDLLAKMTRDRKDGYIYAYIRHGGAVMPSYGAQVTAKEAYDLINYIRHLQQTEPR